MIDVDSESIYSVFDKMAELHPDKTGVIYLGTKYSYRMIKTLAERFASGLLDRGIGSGRKVILYIPNSIQWVISWLGIQRIGAIPVPITPIYTPHDLSYVASDSGADAIVCSDTNFGYVSRVISETRIRLVVTSNMADLLPFWKRFFGYLYDVVPRGKISRGKDSCPIRNLISIRTRISDQLPKTVSGGNNTAEILYTGGTTKFPKGVPISHALFLTSSHEQIHMSDSLFPPEENVVMGNAPLFHILGQTCSLAALLAGGSLIIQPRVNLDAAFDSIQRFKARTMIGVPMLYRMILEHPRIDQYDLSSIDYYFSGGDMLPLEIGKRWMEKFNREIRQGYGATETCGGVAMCPTNRKNPAKSVGQVVPSKTVRIVDPSTLNPVAPGESGELLVSSKYMVKAYLNKPQETAESFIELGGQVWYRTADIMSMDENGYLFFVDRTVDTIKHKGYRVSASEIETVLQEHPAVVASCVVGIPDEAVGERIKAYVVLKEDVKGITGYDLIKWCRKSLVSYKVPHYIEFRDMLPKSKVGKLLRREIRSEEKRRSAI
ncbi:MAG: class I adenylate-forming enzyme family protein [Thermodesulfobacteriota bacterium]